MKKFVLLSAVTAALVFAASNSNASGNNPVLSITATAEVEKTNETTSTAYVATTTTLSLGNKQIYAIISNAVANASTYSHGNISSKILPADGYIAFNPETNDGEVYGQFYVTNKAGFYYQLSGFDANVEYYSWIELDSQNEYYSDNGFYFGWENSDGFEYAPFSGVSSFNYNKSTGNGTETDTSTALLYIHDDPYAYDDANNPYIYWDNADYMDQGGGDDENGYNYNSIEVRGILAITLTTSKGQTTGSGTLTGSGNLTYTGTYYEWCDLVKTATVTLK